MSKWQITDHHGTVVEDNLPDKRTAKTKRDDLRKQNDTKKLFFRKAPKKTFRK